MAIDHEVLTVKEVSELLRVHPSTVHKMIKEGRLTALRIGTDWRVRKAGIVRLLAERT
jgi:excisionase family DNA binding protein